MWQIKCVFWHAIRYGTLYAVIAVLSVLLYSCREKSNPTLPSVLPRLSHPPNTTAIGTSYAVVKWQEQHTGDGPICAYAIDRRMLGEDVPPWLTAVFVSEQLGSQSKEELVFNLTGLEPETDYQVSVRPILCDGARVSELGEGPILSLTTPSIVLPTLMEAPQSTNLSSTHVTIRWTNQHQGDGPICGYGINIKKNDDKDRGDDDDPWRSVGYVSVESELLYDVGHLEANTTYQVVVSPINCISAREGPREPILHFTTKTVTIHVVVLPTLMEAPQSTNMSSTHVTIRWTNQHQGDGPICGYGINIKNNDDKDRGDDESSDAWRSVGYVSVESELLYDVGHLEANTTYQVIVSPINCISAREGPREPILQFTTKTVTVSAVVLPNLSHPPYATAIGTSYAVIQWQEQHTGDGPICAYAIDSRSLGEDIPSWLSVGFVSEQLGSQSKEELVFNLTGLEPETDYQVSVRPILCDGTRASELGEGPILSLTMPSIVLPTLMEAPQSTNLSSTHVTIRWTNQHQGDGPICGYGINIKNNDDKDRGDDDDSDPWRSVGYVSVESELLYDVGHLEANTTYQVAVSPINCISARDGPREPIFQFTTKPLTIPVVVLPRLFHPPYVKSIGTSYAVVKWQEQHSGDGPICAYAIDRRSLDEDVPSWLSVGFVFARPGSKSREELIFNLTGLEPETYYQVSVRPILCDGTRASELGEGPILSLTTPSIEVLTTEPLITEPPKTEPKYVPISGASFCTKPRCTVIVVLFILGYYLISMREE